MGEIARIKADPDYRALVAAEGQRDQARAEVERLRDRVQELELSLGSVCSERDEARAVAERLRAALAEAIELADEGWDYASDYFRKKWDADGRLERLRSAAREALGEGT